jgi:WD40 repeat protein
MMIDSSRPLRRHIHRLFKRWVAVTPLIALLAGITGEAHADLLVTSCCGPSYESPRGGVLAFDETTGGFLGTLIPSGSGGLANAVDLTYGPNGNLYVLSGGTISVLEYNGVTGEFLRTVVPTGSGGLSGATRLTFGPNGNLFVSSYYSGILEYDGTTGAFIKTFVPIDSGGLSAAATLVFGQDGNLLVGDYHSPGSLLQYDGTTGAFLSGFVPSGTGGLAFPAALAFGPNGNLFVNSGTDSVVEYDGATGAFIGTFVPSGSGGLVAFTDLTFGPNGNLFITNIGVPPIGNASSVLEYDGNTGAFLSAFVSPIPVPWDRRADLNYATALTFSLTPTTPQLPYIPTPEPTSLAFFATGVIAFGWWTRSARVQER